jgi:hypothetical protein
MQRCLHFAVVLSAIALCFRVLQVARAPENQKTRCWLIFTHLEAVEHLNDGKGAQNSLLFIFMKSLVCVVIGDGSVFVVDIDERNKVAHLKEMITEKNRYPFASKDLKLYVAKKDGNWLKTSDPSVKQLEQGDVPDPIKVVMEENGKNGCKLSHTQHSVRLPEKKKMLGSAPRCSLEGKMKTELI